MKTILMAVSIAALAQPAIAADWKDLLRNGLDDWIVLGDGHWRL